MSDSANNVTNRSGSTLPSDSRSAGNAQSQGNAYRITVRGALDDSWSTWFDGLQISSDANGDTTLAGNVRDQAALHGLLAKIRDLGLTLLAVEPRSAAPRAPAGLGSSRSPVAAIAGSIVAGLALAVAFVLGPASSGSEAVITGSVLFAFGVGWGLMAYTTGRFSAQPQRWTLVPAAVLGLVGLGLVLVRPGPAAMDVLGWIWPPAIAALTVWMIAQTRVHLRGRGRLLVFPVSALLLLFAIGGGVASISAAVAEDPAATAGQPIDVGGRQLYLECHGSGSPVVVLQAGLSGSAADWGRVAPTVAGSTTVCAYDRAGHGWSDPTEGPQDGTAIAADLRTLLDRAGIAGPYVLVGHSSGGPYMRVFAARHPDEVAGMVLLDAQPADAFTALPDYPAFYGPYRTVTNLAPSLARIGVGFLLGSPADPSGIEASRALRDEVSALPDALRQAQELTTIGDRPLVVLSAGSGQQPGWSAAQQRLVDLSSNVAHRVIRKASHDSFLFGADAPASAQAILDVVSSVRTGSPIR